jgi:hypothetical protein
MRSLFSFLMVSLFATLFIVACSKAKNESSDEISKDVLDKIAELGFSTTDVKAADGGYIVEGDIFLSPKNLSESPVSPNLIIASEEQYHTFNLVTGLPRTITVSLNTTAQYFVDATNEAINRYNAQNLRLNFQLVNGDADIDIVTFYQVSNTIGSGGFPTSSGNPHGQIRLNTYYFTPSAAIPYLATVIAHEIGHCIGFRHTDYMSRRYSCGSGGNEGSAKNGIGAVHIPGTPTGPDPNSFMLACIGNGVNRPFNANDIVALNYLY